MNNMRMISAFFSWKLNPARIDRRLAHCTRPYQRTSTARGAGGLATLACVQRRIKPVGSIEPFIDDVERFVREAAEQGAELIVFPEYNFFDLFGFIPGFSLVNSLLRSRAQRDRRKPAADYNIKPRIAPTQVPSGIGVFFMAIAGAVERAMNQIMSRLAGTYGICVYSGSYVKNENGRLYNVGSVFDQDGKCVCTQKKLHLTDEETGMGMSRGDRLEIVDLPFGRMAFPICMDATYFETFRVAAENGADIVALPISNSEEYDLASSLRGIWGRVIESYVFGLKASQNGWVAGMHFTGIAGVFAPLEMSPKGDGLLAASPGPEGDSLVVAQIDVGMLRQARSQAEYYGDRNPAFEKEYVKRAYMRKRED